MFKQLSLVAIVATLLSGCLGGSSSSTPAATTTTTTASATTFPFAAAGTAQTANGWSKNFTASQTGSSSSSSCSGSGTITVSPANTATTFALTPTNTVSALSATEIITLTWSNCTPATTAATTTRYANPSTYAYYGAVQTGNFYNVALIPPVFPTTVVVGDTGILGTINQYTNSTETVANGIDQESYTVTADTATTAIITIIDTITGSTANS